jgi:hypothetical protein
MLMVYIELTETVHARVPTSGTPNPPEPIPEWRKVLIRVSGWRSYGGTRVSDEELVRNARAEFDRVGSEFYGYQTWSAVIKDPNGVSFYRVVVASPRGETVLKNASSEAEALGRALAEHIRRGS